MANADYGWRFYFEFEVEEIRRAARRHVEATIARGTWAVEDVPEIRDPSWLPAIGKEIDQEPQPLGSHAALWIVSPGSYGYHVGTEIRPGSALRIYGEI
jgi:hypothetical protein